MILVTLGTQDKQFVRLLDCIQDAIDRKVIIDEVIVQAGFTKYKSKNMKIFDLIPITKFDDYVKKCDLLITHGGVGSILTGLKNNKKIIAMPRLKKYGEHVNDHQIQILNNFSTSGYILYLDDVKNFDKIYEKSKKFKPQKFISNNKKFTENLEKLIKEKI